MLFQNKINQLNTKVSEINATIEDLSRQIEALREQKLALETHLQELGSAENAAESALVQVQTAISMIQAISPDQIATFKDAITALFNTKLPILPPVTPDPEPENPTLKENTIILEPTLENMVEDDSPTIADLLKEEYTKTTTNGHPAWIKRLSVAKLQKLCQERKLDSNGTKAELITRLVDWGLLQADVVISTVSK
jgi:chromosome segregation ATPase